MMIKSVLLAGAMGMLLLIGSVQAAPKTGDTRKCTFWCQGDNGKVKKCGGNQWYNLKGHPAGWSACTALLRPTGPTGGDDAKPAPGNSN